MTLRPASPRILLFLSLFLILVWPGGARAEAAPGKDGEAIAPKPGPVLEVKFQEEAEKPAAPIPTITLDPFFLIEEDASQVRVRRVLVALEFGQPENAKSFDPRTPRLRELIYDFLVSKEQANPPRELKEQEKVLAGLINGCLGQEAVSAVKLDQNFLLLQ